MAPTIGQLAAEERPSWACCGLMITDDGPRCSEFNYRLGDPETGRAASAAHALRRGG